MQIGSVLILMSNISPQNSASSNDYKYLVSHMAFVGQGFRGSSAKWFASGLTAAAVSSEGLTGTGGYASKMALSHGWQVSSGCWLEA